MNISELQRFPTLPSTENCPPPHISSNATLPAMLSAMIASCSPTLHSEEADVTVWQIVSAMARMFYHSEEFSEVTLRCHPSAYSASAIALAVEDADASLISLLAYPVKEGLLEVYLRINRSDPSDTVRSLERHGFPVFSAQGSQYRDANLSTERLNELQHYLNI